MVESAMQKLSLRFCGIIRLLQQCYHRHEIRTCFLNKRATISHSRRLAPRTNLPNLREDFWSKPDRLERQGLLLFPDNEVDNRVADMGTPIVRSSATNFTADTPFTSRVR